MDLCTLIERNATFAPDKPALHFEGHTLSYGASNKRIEQAVPREIIFAEELPRTALGKVQHFVLKELDARVPMRGEAS